MKKFIILFVNVFLLSSIYAQEIQKSGYQYLSPVPDAQHVHSTETIILRFQNLNPAQLTNLSNLIEVNGNINGYYPGETWIANDNKTIIFDPFVDFVNGEIITVSIDPGISADINSGVEPLTYRFTVINSNAPTQFEDPLPKRNTTQMPLAGQAKIMENGVSVPSDFPPIDITVNDNPDSGLIFLNSRDAPAYQLILENSGAPYWYLKVPDDRRDFKPQPNSWMTMMVRDGYGGSGWGYIALDKNHEYIKSFRTSNGYSTDEHELIMTEDGGYFLIGRREETIDMSQYISGGQKNATVRETCIQEYTANDELIFQWRAWDHFDIRDVEIENLYGSYIRFPHINAIFLDDDGHIVISSRHLSEVTKIHRQTGEIIWRLSGAHNDFTFVGDPLDGFRNQHAIRALGNGHYTVYDNGNLHDPPTSRAVEYALDTLNMTATMVWQYQNEWPQYHSHYMGNTQRLPNGNTLINWAIGELPNLTEVRPNGEKAFEMWFSRGTDCYRTFRFPWDGVKRVPYLIIEPNIDNVTMIFNKFGDKNVDYYKIYAGTSSSPTAVIDTSKLTLKRIRDLEGGKRYYFRVTAMLKDGSESDFSNEESADINFIKPGDNLVVNGDFSQGKTGWTWEVSGSASAVWNVDNNISHFQLSSGGTDYYNVQLRQNGVPLIQGKKYIFEFDGWADVLRIAEIKVGQDVSPWTNYSKIGLSAIGTTKKHYTFNFTMEDPSDFSSRVVLNVGTTTTDVYIQNVSLKEDIDTGIEEENAIKSPASYTLYQNYPNPFNPVTQIEFYLPEATEIKLSIYNVLGEEITRLKEGYLSAGRYQVSWNGHNTAGQPVVSGIYYYKLETEKETFSRKMLLLK
jgi:hypothetical protein